MSDRIFGLLMLALAVAYGWGAQQFPVPFGEAEAVGPETFPMLLSVLLGFCSLYMMLRPDPDNGWPVGRTLSEMVTVLVVLLVYTAILEVLGFVIATTLAVGVLCWRMGARPKSAFLVAFLGGVVVYLLFNFVLELPLPAGLLEVV